MRIFVAINVFIKKRTNENKTSDYCFAMYPFRIG